MASNPEYVLRILDQMDQAGFVGCFAERAMMREWAEQEVSMREENNRKLDQLDRKQLPGAASGEPTRKAEVKP